MVRISYDQKPYRKLMMNTWGAEVIASPSTQTEAGRKILAEDPESPGSLGTATSEAVERAATDPDTKYSLGSVLNHVLRHQTVIGLETKKQFEKIGETPDVLIGQPPVLRAEHNGYSIFVRDGNQLFSHSGGRGNHRTLSAFSCRGTHHI